MKLVDLRSDVFSLPTPAMRKAMHDAEPDYGRPGEHPLVIRLEEMVATALRKEAGLFVPSGTMGNLVSLLTLCRRGDEAIMGNKAHLFLSEAGTVSVVGGIHVHTVPNLADGMLEPSVVEGAVRGESVNVPRSRVICLENTHNHCGGTVLSPSQMAQIKQIADRHGLFVHLDGARIFNAAVALGIGAHEIAAYADSIQICLSKGLAAPTGSAICGSADFIKEARHNRKVVGGETKAAVIAAACIVALEQMVDRLAEDHVNARALAEGLAGIAGLKLDLGTVQTNIVVFELDSPTLRPAHLIEVLAVEGVVVGMIDPIHLRAVTHNGICRQDVELALVAVRRVMGELTGRRTHPASS